MRRRVHLNNVACGHGEVVVELRGVGIPFPPGVVGDGASGVDAERDTGLQEGVAVGVAVDADPGRRGVGVVGV